MGVTCADFRNYIFFLPNGITFDIFLTDTVSKHLSAALSGSTIESFLINSNLRFCFFYQASVLFPEFIKRFFITSQMLTFLDHIFEFYRERVNQLKAVKL